jgi:hypothetical protein
MPLPDTDSNRLSVDEKAEEADMDFLEGAPIVRRLSGSLPSDASEDDYARYLEAKYGAPSDEPD